ncbi:MAG: histidine phosphatase family protein [Thermoplasmataceae archaeon]
MKEAFLIRHGESEANVKGIVSEDIDHYHLTENGREQAERSAKMLKGCHIDRIYSSPILRARETAEIVSDVLGVQVEIEDDIRESGLGNMNGKPFHSLPFGGREEFGMEPWPSLVKRMERALQKHEGKNIYISHALPIRAVIANYLGLSELDSYGIEIRFASISVVDLSESRVLSIGSLKPSEAVRKSF